MYYVSAVFSPTGGGPPTELNALAKIVQEIYGEENAISTGIGGFQSGTNPRPALERIQQKYSNSLSDDFEYHDASPGNRLLFSWYLPAF